MDLHTEQVAKFYLELAKSGKADSTPDVKLSGKSQVALWNPGVSSRRRYWSLVITSEVFARVFFIDRDCRSRTSWDTVVVRAERD